MYTRSCKHELKGMSTFKSHKTHQLLFTHELKESICQRSSQYISCT